MPVSIVQTGWTALTQSFIIFFQLLLLYLSFTLFSPSFSPTNREINLRKSQKNKKPKPLISGEMFQYLFPLWTGLETSNLCSPSPHGKKIVQTLCSEWMKHFVVNNFGTNFWVQLDCAQGASRAWGRWSHSWEACWVKPEMSIYSVRHPRVCGLQVWGPSSVCLLRRELFPHMRAWNDL